MSATPAADADAAEGDAAAGDAEPTRILTVVRACEGLDCGVVWLLLAALRLALPCPPLLTRAPLDGKAGSDIASGDTTVDEEADAWLAERSKRAWLASAGEITCGRRAWGEALALATRSGRAVEPDPAPDGEATARPCGVHTAGSMRVGLDDGVLDEGELRRFTVHDRAPGNLEGVEGAAGWLGDSTSGLSGAVAPSEMELDGEAATATAGEAEAALNVLCAAPAPPERALGGDDGTANRLDGPLRAASGVDGVGEGEGDGPTATETVVLAAGLDVAAAETCRGVDTLRTFLRAGGTVDADDDAAGTAEPAGFEAKDTEATRG